MANKQSPMKGKEKSVFSTDDLKLIYDFKFNAIKESALAVYKGMSFYLAITAALVGYVFTQDVSAEIKSKAVIIGISISLLSLIACSTIVYGIVKGLKSISELIKINNEEL